MPRLSPVCGLLHYAQNKNPDVKDVRAFLMKENRSWRVPERRVQKFVKRQTHPSSNTTATTSTEDDDVKSISSVKGRVKGMLKGAGRIFGSAKAKKSAVEAVPVFEIRTTMPLLPPMIDIERTESTEEELLPPTPTPERTKSTKEKLLPPTSTPERTKNTKEILTPPAPTPDATLGTEVTKTEVSEIDEITHRELPDESLIYKDDNDGKKDRPCAPCEGCIVM